MDNDAGPKRTLTESLNALVTRYSGRIQRFVQKRLCGMAPENIDDVAQETYLRLLRLVAEGSMNNPEAYVIKVASNVVNDFVSKHSLERDRMSFDSEEVDRHSERTEEPWIDSVSNEIENKQLVDLVHRLPPKWRTALILCEHEGYTYEEAAERVGTSPDTIKRWLSEAKARYIVIASRR